MKTLRLHRILASSVVAALLLAACSGTGDAESGSGGPGAGQSGSAVDALPEPVSLKDLGELTGVAQLEIGPNCTATLIDTGVDDAPAYLLTAGHCADGTRIPAQAVTVDEPFEGTATFLNTFDNQDKLVVDAVQLEYSTMRERDLAIVRLDSTLGELRDAGIRPIPIEQGVATEGTPVRNVAVPVQGLEQEDWVLRATNCTLGGRTDLIESGWLWFDQIRVDCAGVREGSSGSPLIALTADGEPAAVTSIINTTTVGGSEADAGFCSLGRPCELSEDGKTKWVPDTSYAVPLDGLSECFADGVFALGGACSLVVPPVWANQGGGPFRGGDLPDATGTPPHVNLSANPALGASQSVRTALRTLEDPQVCQLPETYEGAETLSVPATEGIWEEGLPVPVTLPEEEGFYAFCAVAGEDYQGAATVIFEVDRTPPAFDPVVEVEPTPDDPNTLTVLPVIDPPEIAIIRQAWVPGDGECPAREDFQMSMGMLEFVEENDRPKTYCAYGLDSAGNESGIVRVFLPKDYN